MKTVAAVNVERDSGARGWGDVSDVCTFHVGASGIQTSPGDCAHRAGRCDLFVSFVRGKKVSLTIFNQYSYVMSESPFIHSYSFLYIEAQTSFEKITGLI